jgi:hypothetical protein
VFKVRKEDGRVSADLFIYIDNFRPTAPSEQECWQASRKAGSTLNFLVLQESPRKYRPGSMTPGPWAGSMAYTNDEEVRVLIAKKKLEKGKVKWKMQYADIMAAKGDDEVAEVVEDDPGQDDPLVW